MDVDDNVGGGGNDIAMCCTHFLLVGPARPAQECKNALHASHVVGIKTIHLSISQIFTYFFCKPSFADRPSAA